MLPLFIHEDKKKLGEGSYGSVSKATNISTKAIRKTHIGCDFSMAACDASSAFPQAIRAVKTISKAQMKNIERFKQDVTILLNIFGEKCQIGGI